MKIGRAPWRIGTFKYLEFEIEKWSSRAKWGQAGPGGTRLDQAGPNGAKRGQMGPNGAKRGQMGPNRAKQGQTGLNRAKLGQAGPIGVTILGLV